MSAGEDDVEEIPVGDEREMIDSVVGRFRDRHGRDPEGVWRAPGRVNLIGEHTDYNGGRCLPIAIEHATWAAIGRRDDGRVSAESLQSTHRFGDDIDTLTATGIDGWPAYAVGVVWAGREAGLDWPGLDIVVSSTVPIGAGLSSSASLESAVAIGIAELAGERVDDALRRRLVDLGVRAEREVAGAPTGGLDQTVSLFADHGHALALDFGSGTTEPVRWDPSAAGLDLLVVDTRVSHRLADGGYAVRRDECEHAAAELGVTALSAADADDVERLADRVLRRRARHVLSENARVVEVVGAVADGRWGDVGRRFDESHASLRDDFEVSCAELDVVCELAVDSGALGARMTGGGFGGSAIALVPTDRLDAVRLAIGRDFSQRGWAMPGFLRSRAGGGAARADV